IELRQQEPRSVRLRARDGERPLVHIGFLLPCPVEVRLGADDRDRGPIDDAHPVIVAGRLVCDIRLQTALLAVSELSDGLSMWIVRVELQRSYTFVVLALLILGIGPLTIARTPPDIFPDIAIQVVTVILNYGGLSAHA